MTGRQVEAVAGLVMLWATTHPVPAPQKRALSPCLLLQAFGATGAMEAAWFVATGQSLALSEQQLMVPVECPRGSVHAGRALLMTHASRWCSFGQCSVDSFSPASTAAGLLLGVWYQQGMRWVSVGACCDPQLLA